MPTASDTEAVPSWTAVGPVARTTWEAPAWTVPAHSVEPEEIVVACTQHGAEAVTVISKELSPTGKVADDPVDDEATIWLGKVVGVVLVLR